MCLERNYVWLCLDSYQDNRSAQLSSNLYLFMDFIETFWKKKWLRQRFRCRLWRYTSIYLHSSATLLLVSANRSFLLSQYFDYLSLCQAFKFYLMGISKLYAVLQTSCLFAMVDYYLSHLSQSSKICKYLIIQADIYRYL